jgi:hypothetical protein
VHPADLLAVRDVRSAIKLGCCTEKEKKLPFCCGFGTGYDITVLVLCHMMLISDVGCWGWILPVACRASMLLGCFEMSKLVFHVVCLSYILLLELGNIRGIGAEDSSFVGWHLAFG